MTANTEKPKQNACFAYETIVHSRRFSKEKNKYVVYYAEINHLRVGDEVLSRCEETGELAYKKVLKVFEHTTGHYTAVNISFMVYPTPDYGYPYPITVTNEHPFWVLGRGWVDAQNLQPGDELITPDSSERATVYDVEQLGGGLYGFNLEVEDFHTHFIGIEGVWVRDG